LHVAPTENLDTLVPSFARSLRAANKASTTLEVYVGGARQLVNYLRVQGMPTKATEVTRDHIEVTGLPCRAPDPRGEGVEQPRLAR